MTAEGAAAASLCAALAVAVLRLVVARLDHAEGLLRQVVSGLRSLHRGLDEALRLAEGVGGQAARSEEALGRLGALKQSSRLDDSGRSARDPAP